jgi:hypothetical protein
MSMEYDRPLSEKQLRYKTSTQMVLFYGLAKIFPNDVVGLIIEQLACPNCGGVTCGFCAHGHDNRFQQIRTVCEFEDSRDREWDTISINWCGCCAKYTLSTTCSSCAYGGQCDCYDGQAFTYGEMLGFMLSLREPSPGGDGPYPDQTQYECKHWNSPFIDPTAYGESAESSDKRAKEFDSLVLTLTEFEKEKNRV